MRPSCRSKQPFPPFYSQDNMVKSNIDKKFSAHYDAVEAELKSSTVGEPSAAPAQTALRHIKKKKK